MTDDSARKRSTADSFGERADRYLASPIHREGEDLDRLASWCAGATRALDVATGAGHTAGALVDVGVPTVVATDASPRMVATAVTAFPDVSGVVGDAERLPVADDAFEAVTCRIAAHHFPSPEAFVAEVARVLRPGGVIAFEDLVAPPDGAMAAFLDRLERLHDPSHVESHPMPTWEAWLARAGFAVERTVHLMEPLPFDSWVAGMDDPVAAAHLRRSLLEAPPEVASFFDIRTAGDQVRSFRSPKALIQATLVG